MIESKKLAYADRAKIGRADTIYLCVIDPRTGVLHGGTESRKDGVAAGY